jgi:hypothetical protein
MPLRVMIAKGTATRPRADQWRAQSQLTALFTSAPVLVFGGGQLLQDDGDRPQAPSSRFAASLKPNVA